MAWASGRVLGLGNPNRQPALPAERRWHVEECLWGADIITIAVARRTSRCRLLAYALQVVASARMPALLNL